MKTAILVDGGFYRRRAQIAFGDISAQNRAIELANYCRRHLNSHGENNNVYFIMTALPRQNEYFIPFCKGRWIYQNQIYMYG